MAPMCPGIGAELALQRWSKIATIPSSSDLQRKQVVERCVSTVQMRCRFEGEQTCRFHRHQRKKLINHPLPPTHWSYLGSRQRPRTFGVWSESIVLSMYNSGNRGGREGVFTPDSSVPLSLSSLFSPQQVRVSIHPRSGAPLGITNVR